MAKKLSKGSDDLRRPRIGIDLLGCDTLPNILLKHLLEHDFEESLPPLLTFFGTKEVFAPFPDLENTVIVDEEITFEDDPLKAVRSKKNSSMVVGIQQLKHMELDAFISAGNTGALLASAKLHLQMLPGIDRPALITLIPTKKEPVAVIDVGANVAVKPENLFQFAQIGVAYQKARGIESPSVGLLNIGEEKGKGTPEVRAAYKLLQELDNFVGNIEGRDVFRGDLDVLVTDGFTGNIFLKTSEGIAGFVLDQLHELGPIASIPGIRSILNALEARLSFAEYPGAIMCGVEGIVMKCHGASNADSFAHSIKSAGRLVRHFFIEKIRNELK